MADDSDSDGGSRRFVSFQSVISLGNALIILTMLGSAGGVLMITGRELQGVLDDGKQMHADLLHEAEMRVAAEKSETDARIQSERAIVGQVTSMANQESRDVQQINSTLQNMRDDYRELLRIAGPTQGRK